MASINLKHQAAPETPGTDFSKLFIDVADGKLKKKNSAGAVINLEQGQVVSVFGRTGEVVAQTGDYTASQVGADPAGTGASASAAAVAAHVAAPDPHPGYVLDGDLTTLLAGKENVGVAAALIAGLVDSAPGALDTLNELAAALGDDANFASTVTTALTARELIANKDTDPLLAADSDTLYPSQKAVKAYIDAAVPAGTPFKAARFSSAGLLDQVGQISIDDNGYVSVSYQAAPNGLSGNFNTNGTNLVVQPLQNSPDESWNLSNNYLQFDTASNGFSLGDNGVALRFVINGFSHQGTGDLGGIEFIQNNFQIGNGTDPIDIKGLGYIFGFGSINANVNISGALQGYGFQPNVDAAATLDVNAYTQAFYDAANIGCPTRGHTSFNASPTIAVIPNGYSFQGMAVNPSIPVIDASGGITGVSVGGNLGTFGANSYYNGISVNPNIASARYAAGLNVTMDNVTVYPGISSSLVIQDLTIAADVPSAFGDTVSIEYTPGAVAGAEVVSQIGLAFTVQIESGVSTATQVAAALNAFFGFTSNLNVTISGVGSNPQVTQAATNLAGGEDPGRKQAAFLDGDVEITGSLTFVGELGIAKLNAFASQALVNGGGSPGTIHGLITQPTVAANVTVALADTIGVNTAMLLTIGDNAVVTTGFVGVSALALPAVVSMGAGSTIDRVAASTFAVNLDATATGGTIDILDLCRSVAIPNGVTAINKLHGFIFDLPFGDPGTVTWGFYESPGAHNFFAGDLKIGSGTDIADSGYKLHVEGGGFLLEDASTLISALGSAIGFFGATPVVQQASSGAATAGALYTATEQTMIQEMYTALRAYGLLT